MAEESGGEKSYEPTPQRLDDARRRGDVPISKDIAAAAAYAGLLLAAAAVGAAMTRGAGEALAAFLARADTLAPRLLGPGGPGLSLGAAAGALAPMAPLFVLPAALVLLGVIGQRALVVAPEKLSPRLSRISPIAQAKQKFGPTGLAEFAKSAVKLTAISVLLGIYLAGEADRVIGLARLPAAQAPREIADIALGLLMRIAAIAAALAFVDLIWQRFDHRRKLRMTHQEVRDEMKRSEGDPQTKAQRRRRGEEIAKNRMMLDVPKASVVIVNPTHYAVALRWNRGEDAAPVVVAKGVDDTALRIRRTAERAGVPLHHDPPTARLIEATVEIGREIEPAQYKAAAAAIRFAEAMRAKARARGGDG